MNLVLSLQKLPVAAAGAPELVSTGSSASTACSAQSINGCVPDTDRQF